MKRFLILALSFLFIIGTDASFAQVQSSRKAGYKGNLTYTNRLFIMSGVETTHGYMLNEHHFVGVGAGVFILPTDGMRKIYADAFLDYHAYIMDKKSTPIVGVQLGYLHNCNNPTVYYPGNMGVLQYKTADGFTYNNDAVEFAPGAGWSWAIWKRLGVSLAAYADLYFYKNPDITTVILPKFALGIEF